jgi:hypothetical protein
MTGNRSRDRPTSQLILYGEIIAVFSEHFKHVHIVCGKNVEFFNVKPDVTYSIH